MKNIKISIVILICNVESLFFEAIVRNLTQTIQELELIIVDNCSTDESCSIVKSSCDLRICLFCRLHDFIISLNIGIEASSDKKTDFLNSLIALVNKEKVSRENFLQIIYRIFRSKLTETDIHDTPC